MTLKNSIRIIGGQWRGRKLVFPENTSIRPTLDQVRETLFNWLQPFIHQAHCLDAFAGSGALGIEALSRGADQVTFIDQDEKVIRQIKHHLAKLNVENSNCIQCAMPHALTLLEKKAYDIIFLDPPFISDLLEKTLYMLEESEIIKASTLIYFETNKQEDLKLSEAWEIFRSKKTKHIFYGILKRSRP